jgi:hypothetical protein
MNFRLLQGRMLDLQASDVCQRLADYVTLTTEQNRAAFVELLPKLDGFWDAFDGLAASSELFTVCRLLLELDKTDARELATKRALSALRELKNEDWDRALRDGSEPLPTLARLNQLDVQPDLGTTLVDSLRTLLLEALNGASFEQSVIERWFDVCGALKLSARKTLLKDIRDGVFNAPESSKLKILEAGGSRFLDDGDFREMADQSVRRVVIPLLGGQQRGIEWLAQNSERVRGWIGGAARETRDHLVERMSDISRSENEDSSRAVRSLAPRLSISLINDAASGTGQA